MGKASCARIAGCPLFKLFSQKSGLVIWKLRYCEGEPERCERLRRVTTGVPVPQNLLPNGKLLDVSLDAAGPEHLGEL